MSLSETDPPVPEETLHIQNFAGITDARITLSRMNVFIGPQASGKSVCAKLIYYFRSQILKLPLYITYNKSDDQIHEINLLDFYRRFRHTNLGSTGFKIEYSFGNIQFSLLSTGGEHSKLTLNYSEAWKTVLQSARAEEDSDFDLKNDLFENGIRPYINKMSDLLPKHFFNRLDFIAAGRSFFITLKNVIFSLQSTGAQIDPFLLEFGSDYERAKHKYFEQAENPGKQYSDVQKRIETILKGEYLVKGDNEYIRHQDGRLVLLEDCSSGQQEALPLALILSTIGRNTGFLLDSTLFAEEPEAHLYPDAQREMVHLLCTALNLTSPESASQCVITTHSPYILTALNNLMYGAKIAKEFPSRLPEVRAILGETDLIPPENVRAYVFKDGTVKSIISEKTGLVVARELDGVSDKLAQEFEALVEIAFEESEDE